MNTYNRYHHCGETFYTGTAIKEIVCSECDTQIKFDDIIKTQEPVYQQDTVKPVETFKEESELE